MFRHLLICSDLTSFDSFIVLKKKNQNFILELKERLLITGDKPSLNKNIEVTQL